MRSRRTAIGTIVAVLVAVVVVAGATLGFAMYASLSVSSSISTSTLQTSSAIASTSALERSGPISTYPAVWTDACNLPVHGNLTTSESFMPTSTNITLNQVYSDIVSSANFTSVSVGLGWVTTAWSMQEDSGPSGSFEYVVGQFVLLNASGPDGYVQANYNLGTGAVTIDYEQYLISSCPAEQIGSSYGAALTEYSPAYYALGTPVNISFYVVDYTVTDLPVSSSSSCLGSFTVLQGIGTGGPVVYNSTEHGGCSGAPINVQLDPGQSYNQTVTWNQTDDAGAQVPPGAYEVMGNTAGSGESPIGEVYIGTPLQALNSSVLQKDFYFEAYVSNSYPVPGQPVRVVWVLSNEGQQVYDLQTAACSYAYTITSLTGIVFQSAKQTSCSGQLQDSPAPPMGGISHIVYWNQTDSSGALVAPGFYRAVIDLHVWSGGQEFNMTSDSDFEITASSNPSAGEQISVSSSSICADCAGSPYLYSSVDANGMLKSLQLYLNGTLVGTMHYNLPCCELDYQVNFDTPINSSIPIVPGVSYDIVLVGTFQGGNTSISWANPVNRAD